MLKDWVLFGLLFSEWLQEGNELDLENYEISDDDDEAQRITTGVSPKPAQTFTRENQKSRIGWLSRVFPQVFIVNDEIPGTDGYWYFHNVVNPMPQTINDLPSMGEISTIPTW